VTHVVEAGAADGEAGEERATLDDPVTGDVNEAWRVVEDWTGVELDVRIEVGDWTGVELDTGMEVDDFAGDELGVLIEVGDWTGVEVEGFTIGVDDEVVVQLVVEVPGAEED
jgi:hypothetical protein